MANKKSPKKGAATQTASSQVHGKKADTSQKVVKAKQGKAPAKAAKGKNGKAAKPGFLTRVKNYFASVRTEMKRVTWPTKEELIRYSVAVCVSLVVVGVVIAALDFVIGEGLVLFSGLRG